MGLPKPASRGTGMELHPLCAGQQMNRTEFTVRVLCLPDSDSTFELRGKAYRLERQSYTKALLDK